MTLTDGEAAAWLVVVVLVDVAVDKVLERVLLTEDEVEEELVVEDEEELVVDIDDEEELVVEDEDEEEVVVEDEDEEELVVEVLDRVVLTEDEVEVAELVVLEAVGLEYETVAVWPMADKSTAP